MKDIELQQADGAEYLTCQEAGKVLRIKEQTVRDLLTKGRMVRYKFKGVTLLKRTDVESYKREVG